MHAEGKEKSSNSGNWNFAREQLLPPFCRCCLVHENHRRIHSFPLKDIFQILLFQSSVLGWHFAPLFDIEPDISMISLLGFSPVFQCRMFILFHHRPQWDTGFKSFCLCCRAEYLFTDLALSYHSFSCSFYSLAYVFGMKTIYMAICRSQIEPLGLRSHMDGYCDYVRSCVHPRAISTAWLDSSILECFMRFISRQSIQIEWLVGY